MAATCVGTRVAVANAVDMASVGAGGRTRTTSTARTTWSWSTPDLDLLRKSVLVPVALLRGSFDSGRAVEDMDKNIDKNVTAKDPVAARAVANMHKNVAAKNNVSARAVANMDMVSSRTTTITVGTTPVAMTRTRSSQVGGRHDHAHTHAIEVGGEGLP